MASTASPLKQAGDLGREAEEAAANGLFEEATRKYLLAAQCFVDATKHTADAQMIQSLNLLAQTHRNRAEELQLYLEAAKTLQASGGDSYYQGGSLAYSNGYDSGDDDYYGDDYGDDEPGQHHRQHHQRGEGPTYWEGEDMIYARSSSPFGSSDPLLFVFTKDDARPAPAMVESQFYEIRSRGDLAAAGSNSESESSPGSSSSSSSSTSTSSSSSVNNNNSSEAESIMFSVDGSSDEFMSTWQRMLMGMDRLLDILPRSTIPFAAAASPASPSPTGERRSPQAAQADHHHPRHHQNAQPAGSQLGSSGDAGAGRVAESFVLVPSSRSRSPSPTSSTDSAATATAPALQGSVLDYSGLSKEDLLRELQRLNQAVEYLRAENAALVKAQEEKKEATRENEMLKESILRFRTEFEKQTHQLHQAQPVKLSKSIVGSHTKRSVHPANPLAHSALSSGGHRAAHHRVVAPHPNRHHPSGALHSGRSLSSSSSHFASASASPPPAAAKNPSSSLGLDSSLSPSMSSSASSAQSTVMMTSAASPLSASMFWIQNIQMKRLKELEERNRALAKQLKQLRKQAGGSDKKVAALEEENRRQREVIDKYDEKWKKLERSAREKMKQRRESLSRTSSSPTPPAGAGGGGGASSTIPSSLSEGSGLPIIAIPALSSSPSGSMHSPGSSPISSPLSSSPSSSFLMHAASSSLLSPSSSLFLNSSSIADDAGRGREH